MKKGFMFALALLILPATALTAHAAEVEVGVVEAPASTASHAGNLEPSTITLEDGSTLTCPYAYGELKDGIFVRTEAQEIAWIPDNAVKGTLKTEQEKMWSVRVAEYYTPEMEAAGYTLSPGGNIIEPGTSFGDAPQGDDVEKITGASSVGTTEVEYDENGNPIVSYNAGYISMVTFVHPDIHEKVFIEMTNMDTKNTYSVDLFEENSYTKSFQLPAGEYRITGGGISSDFTSAYPVVYSSFTVEAGVSTIVTAYVGVTEDTVENGTVVDVTGSEESAPEETEVSQEESPMSNFVGIAIAVIAIIIVVAVGAAIALFVMQKKRNELR